MNCLWLLIYLFLALSWPVSDRSRIADNETIIHHIYKTEESSWYVEFWSIITSVYHVANSVCWGMQKLNEDADYKSCILSYVSQQSWKASHYHFSRCLYLYRDQFFFLNFLFNKTFFFNSSAPAKYEMIKLLICFYLSFPHLKYLHIFQMWISKLVGGLQPLEAITCTKTRCYNKYTHIYNHRTIEWLGLVWSNHLR